MVDFTFDLSLKDKDPTPKTFNGEEKLEFELIFSYLIPIVGKIIDQKLDVKG